MIEPTSGATTGTNNVAVSGSASSAAVSVAEISSEVPICSGSATYSAWQNGIGDPFELAMLHVCQISPSWKKVISILVNVPPEIIAHALATNVAFGSVEPLSPSCAMWNVMFEASDSENSLTSGDAPISTPSDPPQSCASAAGKVGSACQVPRYDARNINTMNRRGKRVRPDDLGMLRSWRAFDRDLVDQLTRIGSYLAVSGQSYDSSLAFHIND